MPDVPDYCEFERYVADGGYRLLRRFLGLAAREHQPDEAVLELLAALNEAGLRGLGGAGFPTGRKWEFVRKEPKPRYLAVNADEGEPGTFKDRHYLERDPHRFLEGVLIAAWSIEAEAVYIYLRDEYPGVRDVLLQEIAKVEAAGLATAGYLRLRRGAGAYICGEESAMLESIEGKRGYPRHRPPFAAQVGLFGRPTLINNVETLYWIRDIVEKGPAWFASQGRQGSKGLRSYSVSGRVRKPGVKLAPAGITARELIDEFCGGMADGHTFKAYLPGGASGGILPAVDGRPPARLRQARAARLLRRLARGGRPVRPGRHEGGRAQSAALLPGRELRPVHAVPGRLREGGQADAAGVLGRGAARGAVAGPWRTPRSAASARRRPIRSARS